LANLGKDILDAFQMPLDGDGIVDLLKPTDGPKVAYRGRSALSAGLLAKP
jgi:hypothetical protein